jgi:HlyD family secretion protein
VTRRGMLIGGVLVSIAAVGAAIVTAMPGLPDRGNAIPTARVAKGPLTLTVHAKGELRAGRTNTLLAPAVGGMLRTVRLAPTGTAVKAGEVVVEFDPADHQFALNQARTELDEAAQEIVKMKADATAQAAQDQVALLTARFDVRRAELDVTVNEFIGAIDAKKNELSLEESRRRLAQLEEDIKSRAATSQASLTVVEEKRNKATLAMQRAQATIDSLQLKAPMDGIVLVKENRDAMGGMMIWGMPMP